MLSKQSGKLRTEFVLKKTLVIALFLYTAAICPAQASPYPGYGGWTTGTWYEGDFSVGMGTYFRALDTFDHYDGLATVSNSGWTGGSYHRYGVNGWDSSTGFYDADSRATMHPGDTKTWMVYIWALPGNAASDLTLKWEAFDYSDPLVLAQMELIQKPSSVIGGPAVGTIWTAPPTMTLPYTTSSGLNGYGFKFTLTMVPEPSSILAILSGLVTMGGLALKRRNK